MPRSSRARRDRRPRRRLEAADAAARGRQQHERHAWPSTTGWSARGRRPRSQGRSTPTRSPVLDRRRRNDRRGPRAPGQLAQHGRRHGPRRVADAERDIRRGARNLYKAISKVEGQGHQGGPRRRSTGEKAGQGPAAAGHARPGPHHGRDRAGRDERRVIAIEEARGTLAAAIDRRHGVARAGAERHAPADAGTESLDRPQRAADTQPPGQRATLAPIALTPAVPPRPVTSPGGSTRATSCRHRSAVGRPRRRPRRPHRRRAGLRRPARRARPADRRRAAAARSRSASCRASATRRRSPRAASSPAGRVAGRRARRPGDARSRDRRPGRGRGRAPARRPDGPAPRDLARRPSPRRSTADAAAVAELVARGVVEGRYDPRTIYRDEVDSAPPDLDELILVAPGARRGGADGGRRARRRSSARARTSPGRSPTAPRTTSAPRSSPTRRAPSPSSTACGSTSSSPTRRPRWGWACSWPSAGAATTRRG